MKSGEMGNRRSIVNVLDMKNMKSGLIVHVNRLKRLYVQMFQEPGKNYGLTQVEIDIMLFLHNNPQYNTARDICTMRGIAKSNVSTSVDALERRGFLFSQTDPDNRKLRRLRLSDSTETMVEELAACQEKCVETILEGFTSKELAMLKEFHRRMDANIAKALQETAEWERMGKTK